MIVFHNPGIIDTDAAFTMGVNVKESDTPIGHFGTGLKFAIAVILRLGGSMTIHRGRGEMIELVSRTKSIRGKDFDLVHSIVHSENDDPVTTALGFTTELGKGWKPWMAFRELACNALDEGGEFYSTMEHSTSEDDHTTIVVNCPEVEESYRTRDNILAMGKPIYADANIEVRTGETNFIFYRGVRIGQLDKTMTHSYNLLGAIELTEDRTFKSSWQVKSQLESALLKVDDEAALKRILTCGEKYLEHHLDLPGWVTPSESFKAVAGSLREDMSHGQAANPAALKLAHDHRLADLGPEQGVELNALDRDKLARAVSILKEAGYPVDEYPITVVASLGPNNLGLAKEGRIFLSRIPFDKGVREVACTLLEEWAHLHTGFGDMTRGLQTFLFDQIMGQIEKQRGSVL